MRPTWSLRNWVAILSNIVCLWGIKKICPIWPSSEEKGQYKIQSEDSGWFYILHARLLRRFRWSVSNFKTGDLLFLPAVTTILPTYWLYIMTLSGVAFFASFLTPPLFFRQEDLVQCSLQQQSEKSHSESIDMPSTTAPPPQVKIH